MSLHKKCEVVDASYRPLTPVTARRALMLCFLNKAEIIEEHPTDAVHTSTDVFPLPVQIRLHKTINIANKPAPITQDNLFARDNWTCQYCGRGRRFFQATEFLTRDHIFPQSRGGSDTWGNIITACNTCNNKKSDLLLADTKMKLLKSPTTPTVFEIRARKRNRSLIS